MQSSSPPGSTRPVVTLCLGQRTVVRCDDGLLAAEYAAFDTTDIVLEATDPVSVREKGYRTTAGEALLRLSRANVTPAVAEQAARSLSLEVASSFARGAAARSVISHLGAEELFDGAIYRAPSTRYEGAWLDLAALSSELAVPRASILLQALHLAAAFAEVPPSTPLYLSTAQAMRDRLPGERTHARVDLDGVLQISDALARLGPRSASSEAHPARDRRMRRALLARVRERLSGVEGSDRIRTQIEGLDAALSPRTMSLGPLAYPQLQAIERQLATGDVSGVDQQLEELERDHGSPAGIRYLRARAARLRGDEPARTVAELLSEIGQHDSGFHQAVLATARKWLAIGQKGTARHFALHLARDPSAPDGDRLGALEILERTGTPVTPPALPAQPAPVYPPPVPALASTVPAHPSISPAFLRQTASIPQTQPSAQQPSLQPPPHESPLQAVPYLFSIPPAPYPSPLQAPPYPSSPPQFAPLEASPLPPSPPLHPALPPALPPQAAQVPSPTPTVPLLQAPLRAPTPLPPQAVPVQNVRQTLQIPPAAQPSGGYYPGPDRAGGENWPATNGVPAHDEDARPGAQPAPVEEYHAQLVDWPRAPRTRSERASDERPAAPFGGPMPVRYHPELAESLPLPAGASESTLDPKHFPKTPLQVRVAMVRCARELGRDYRLRYGKNLRCDVLAVDAMQEHLMRCCVGLPTDETVVWEIQRHGALLSEIIARALGGAWTEVGPSEPGYWTMFIPPGIRTWPIGRVYRFVAMGSRGKDLVAYYLDLEARLRAQT